MFVCVGDKEVSPYLKLTYYLLGVHVGYLYNILGLIMINE